MRLEATAQGAAARSEAAQAGAERVEGHLLGFTKRIANPQSRGAFGEEALRNQLELLGLRENRDFRRQVKVIGSARRIDYAVSLRGVTIGLDPKFALDPDLDGISDALAAGDDARLTEYARKLVARAKELAAKEYWSDLERSPSFVLDVRPGRRRPGGAARAPELQLREVRHRARRLHRHAACSSGRPSA